MNTKFEYQQNIFTLNPSLWQSALQYLLRNLSVIEIKLKVTQSMNMITLPIFLPGSLESKFCPVLNT